VIERYLRELERELRGVGVGGAEAERLVKEAREHLRDAAMEHGEAGALAAFGPARSLAGVVAAELATSRTRRAAYLAFAALAPAGLAYAVLFLTAPAAHASQAVHGTVPGLGPLAFAGAVFFPQFAFVCGVLAVVGAARAQAETELSAADLAVVRRRTGFALAAGALTLTSVAVFALDQHSVVPGWWLAASLVALGVFAPTLAVVGIATVRAGRPAAGPGELTGTAVDDVAAVLAHLPVLSEIRVPSEPRRFALAVAIAAAGAVAVAGIAQGDPLDGVTRAVAEGVAVLGCYGVFGRQLGLRR
jgi:hypothetical protein